MTALDWLGWSQGKAHRPTAQPAEVHRRIEHLQSGVEHSKPLSELYPPEFRSLRACEGMVS